MKIMHLVNDMTRKRCHPNLRLDFIATSIFWSVGVLCSLLLTGCSLTDLAGDSKVPAGTADPAIVASPEGALGLYVGTQQHLANAMGGQGYVVISGLFGDELRSRVIGEIGYITQMTAIDSRFERDGDYLQLYRLLQRVRGASQEARGAVRAYAPLVQRSVVGHLYAMEGFANILLADLFCSGIPLSTIAFGGDFTLVPGSTTDQVYAAAVALADSAIGLANDSVQIQYFARIVKARALLARSMYDEVADEISMIPESYQYKTYYGGNERNGFGLSGNPPRTPPLYVVSDGEGVDDTVGLRYVTLDDPRVRIQTYEIPATGRPPYPGYYPLKYDSTGTTPIVIASGIEARLMLAEAQLHTGGPWLATINSLRTSCSSISDCPSPAPAGSGGVANLPPLEDPGNAQDRVALLFRERALWLFLTGIRQGDMRRLIRNYDVAQDELYATGTYYGLNAAGAYQSIVNFPVPDDERRSNIHYRGCLNRDA